MASTPVLYHVCQNISALYFRAFHHLQIHGTDHIPAGGCLIASNHVSFFDPPLLGCAAPRHFHYLARKTLFTPPVMDKILPRINAVPIDQERPDMVGLKRIIALAKAGAAVVLFPEGARSFNGILQPAQPGIGLVIAKSGVPVVPARIFGAHRAWPRDGKPHPFTPIEVVFGPPIHFKPTASKDRDTYKKIGDHVIQAIAAIQPVNLHGTPESQNIASPDAFA